MTHNIMDPCEGKRYMAMMIVLVIVMMILLVIVTMIVLVIVMMTVRAITGLSLAIRGGFVCPAKHFEHVGWLP